MFVVRVITTLMEGAYGRLTYELTFTEVTDSDFGIYTCTATTNLGIGSTDIELYGTYIPIKYYCLNTC